MQIISVKLHHFRNHTKLSLDFDPQTNLLSSPNGAGKTNLLEAIYFLSRTQSFLPHPVSSLISWGQSFSILEAKISKNEQIFNLEIQLIKSPQTGLVQKKYSINQVQKTRKQFISQLQAVVFQPEDIRLIIGSPTRRREYLDKLLSSQNWRYYQAHLQYQKALAHRSQLLADLQKNQSNLQQLFIWDQILAKEGEYLQQQRLSYLQYLNNFFLTHSEPEIQKLQLVYQPSVISEAKLVQVRAQDLARSTTSIGPHRDDFSFHLSSFASPDKNLFHWGSRGQQRLAVLALKLGEINYIKDQTNDIPIILLDDVFSELDPKHQHLVYNLCLSYQSLITSAEEHQLQNLLFTRLELTKA